MGDHASESRFLTIMPGDPRFAFRVAMPTDWARLTPPSEEEASSGSEEFRPVAIFAAPYGAVVVTLSVRPAPAEGTVAEWLSRLAVGDGIDFSEFGPAMIGSIQGVAAEGEQPSNMGPMHLRVVMFEQGGWAHSLLGMAPAAIWGALSQTFDEIFTSFEMATELPSTVAPWPADDGPGDLAPEGLVEARQTAERFLTAIQQGDEGGARALLRDEDADSVSFPFEGGDDASFELGEARADDGCAVIEATLRSRSAETSELEEQVVPLVLRQDTGEWRIDMTASLERMLGFDFEGALTDLASGLGAATSNALDAMLEDPTIPGSEAGDDESPGD